MYLFDQMFALTLELTLVVRGTETLVNRLCGLGSLALTNLFRLLVAPSSVPD